MRRRRTLSLLATGLVLLLLGLSACDSQSPGSSSAPSRFSLTVQVEDPSGAPIDDARVGVRPCFRLGGLDCGPRLRSSARSEPSSKNDARTASQHLRITEPSISPPYPNPVRDRATFEVVVPNPSTVRSTLHTLDGSVVDTVANTSVDRGVSPFLFEPKKHPSGLYEQRSQVRVDGAVVARDTHYVALFRSGPGRPPFGPEGAAPLGQTDADGTLSTTDRARFPSLYSLPPIIARDGSGVPVGTLRVAPTVQFVVRENRHSEERGFPRAVTADTDTVTLVLP
jgi:hypothetical protein